MKTILSMTCLSLSLFASAAMADLGCKFEAVFCANEVTGIEEICYGKVKMDSRYNNPSEVDGFKVNNLEGSWEVFYMIGMLGTNTPYYETCSQNGQIPLGRPRSNDIVTSPRWGALETMEGTTPAFKRRFSAKGFFVEP